jgi:protein arginine kinase activator
MVKNPEEPYEEPYEEPAPERPIECTECRRPVAIWYTEIVGNTTTQLSMCSECPVLQRKLHGQMSNKETSQGTGEATLTCGECGTTLDSLRLGNLLGCSNCYEIFGDVIFSELVSMEKIPQRLASSTKKNTTLHIGRSPNEVTEISPSLRLLSLNEALNETLKREDYEQAAWLRDQIKALTEENPPEDADDKRK